MRLSALLVLLTATTAGAGVQPVEVALETQGSAITLKFTNKTSAELTFPTHIRADVTNYDWLSLRLRRGKVLRDFSFELSRDKSIPVKVKLAPGASATETIDLAEWAMRGSNGGPLEPGDYDVEATWDATRETPSFRQTVTGKLHVPAPIAGECKDTTHDGLVLLARQVGIAPVLEVGVHNVDKVAHCVRARVLADQVQSDWLQVSLDATGRTTMRKLQFDDDRNASAIVSESLEPGATSWVRFDLQEWAKRSRNGGTAIALGVYYLGIVYDARTEKGVWSGLLSTKLSFMCPP